MKTLDHPGPLAERTAATTRRPADVPRPDAVLSVHRATRVPAPWRCGDDARSSFHRLAPLVAGPNAAARAIGVCSVGAGEGRSWVVAGLACALSEQARRTVVLDTFAPAPVLHDWFGASGEEQGASSDADATTTYVDVAQAPRHDLSIEAQVAAVQRLRALGEARTLLVELAPLRDSVQAQMMGRHLDDLLVVVAAECERREVVTEAVEALRRRDITVLGCVLNRRRRVLPERVYRWL